MDMNGGNEGGKEKRKEGLGIILRVLRVWREPIKLLYPKVFPSISTHSTTPNQQVKAVHNTSCSLAFTHPPLFHLT